MTSCWAIHLPTLGSGAVIGTDIYRASGKEARKTSFSLSHHFLAAAMRREKKNHGDCVKDKRYPLIPLQNIANMAPFPPNKILISFLFSCYKPGENYMEKQW